MTPNITERNSHARLYQAVWLQIMRAEKADDCKPEHL